MHIDPHWTVNTFLYLNVQSSIITLIAEEYYTRTQQAISLALPILCCLAIQIMCLRLSISKVPNWRIHQTILAFSSVLGIHRELPWAPLCVSLWAIMKFMHRIQTTESPGERIEAGKPPPIHLIIAIVQTISFKTNMHCSYLTSVVDYKAIQYIAYLCSVQFWFLLLGRDSFIGARLQLNSFLNLLLSLLFPQNAHITSDLIHFYCCDQKKNNTIALASLELLHSPMPHSSAAQSTLFLVTTTTSIASIFAAATAEIQQYQPLEEKLQFRV